MTSRPVNFRVAFNDSLSNRSKTHSVQGNDVSRSYGCMLVGISFAAAASAAAATATHCCSFDAPLLRIASMRDAHEIVRPYNDHFNVILAAAEQGFPLQLIQH